LKNGEHTGEEVSLRVRLLNLDRADGMSPYLAPIPSWCRGAHRVASKQFVLYHAETTADDELQQLAVSRCVSYQRFEATARVVKSDAESQPFG
jgi:hypothetical protein